MICIECNSDKTRIRNGKYECWFNYKNGKICNKCRKRLFETPRTTPRRIWFKGKRLTLKENVRKGVCQWCGSITGIHCKRTNIHHIQYDTSDPLKDTVELCVSCHTKECHRLGLINGF